MNQSKDGALDFEAIIEKLNIVDVSVSFKSGSVTRSKDRSSKYKGEAFTSGSVRYIDPKELAPFSRGRQSIARLCRLSGGKFFGGVAMGDEMVGTFSRQLKIIIDDIHAAKETLRGTIRQGREEWEADHPEILEFSSHFPSDEQILASIDVAVMACKVDPKSLDGIENGFESSVKGLAGQVLREIAQDVADSFDPDSKKASTRSIQILQRMKAKLDSLAFVDTSLVTVSTMVQKVLRMLPYQGPVKDQTFKAYASLMSILGNPETVVGVAKAMEVTGDTVDADTWLACASSNVEVLDEDQAATSDQGQVEAFDECQAEASDEGQVESSEGDTPESDHDWFAEPQNDADAPAEASEDAGGEDTAESTDPDESTDEERRRVVDSILGMGGLPPSGAPPESPGAVSRYDW